MKVVAVGKVWAVKNCGQAGVGREEKSTRRKVKGGKGAGQCVREGLSGRKLWSVKVGQRRKKVRSTGKGLLCTN